MKKVERLNHYIKKVKKISTSLGVQELTKSKSKADSLLQELIFNAMALKYLVNIDQKDIKLHIIEAQQRGGTATEK